MALYRLYKIFRSSAAFARLDTSVKMFDNPPLSTNQIRYHRLIVRSGTVGAVVGFVFGLGMAAELYTHPRHLTPDARDAFTILLVPFLMTAAGMLGTASWIGAFAPREFLESHVGDYWLVVIGAKNADTARVKAVIIALVVTALFVFLPVCAAIGKI